MREPSPAVAVAKGLCPLGLVGALTCTYHYLVITPRLAVVLSWHHSSMLDVPGVR
jgi:hypothetical protein